ncbi:MAG: hypothetical protein SFY67_11995 [Candidatus Melainabacteria bacterium]|nr:hypothetical protein [Candidatus Melainabacteria bacterium]
MSEDDKSNSFVVFYAWQSDLPNKSNRGFIKGCLEKAIKNLNREISIEQSPRDTEKDSNSIELDHDTKGVPGSPDLASTIFQKIDAADLFVADVSFIGEKKDGSKLFPNPNVLIELGYALKVLGSDKVIIVLNSSTGSSEQLPFDIRHKRQVVYNAQEGSENSAEKQNLVRLFSSAIQNGFAGRVQPQKAVTVDINLVFEKQQISPAHKQWAFYMEFFITNGTTSSFQNYVIEIFIPKGLLSDGTRDYQNHGHDTDSHFAFRYPRTNQSQRQDLLPGKKEKLLVVNGLLHIHNLGKIWDTRKDKIIVNFYVDGLDKQVFEFEIKELNPYRLLKIDEKKLVFNKRYNVNDFPNEEITRVEKCQCH